MANERFGNYSSCCRLCLSDEFNSLKPIFEDDAGNSLLVQKILNFVDVEVTPTDKISTMICDQCLGRVNGWHNFKKSCSENQSKLQKWLSSWSADNDISAVIIQIKDEPVDGDDIREDDTHDQVIIKPELVDPGEHEDCYDDAPILSPQQTLEEGEEMNGGLEHVNVHPDDGSQHSLSSRVSGAGEAPGFDSEADLSESDIEKIQFAAGLRLKSRSLTSNQTLDVPITKMEEAYLDRSKGLLSMLHSFRCACHNMHYPTVKRLYGHLRATFNWFPIFTCYNCVVTFSTRSAMMKHNGKCPKTYLENSIKLAEMQKRTENKIRLYEYYKCTQCNNLYAFFEDYCDHIDKVHSCDVAFVCVCSKEFANIEQFRQHMYMSCYLSYYCDVCYNVFETLSEFKVHCEVEHDKVDDYIFINYHAEYKNISPNEIVQSRKRKFEEMEDSQDGEGNSSNAMVPNVAAMNNLAHMHDIPLTCEVCKRQFGNSYTLRKHMKNHMNVTDENSSFNDSAPQYTGWKNQPTSCTKCGKLFSTYYNMLRHFKTHSESDQLLQCTSCPDKFRLVSELNDHLVNEHGKANICQECGKEFESADELEQHRSVHLNIKVYRDSKTHSYRTATKPRYTCEQCDGLFETEEELTRHMALHLVRVEQNGNGTDSDESKTKRARYSCLECARHYVSYKGLWLHNKRHHQSQNRKIPSQRFKCEHCNRVLSTKAAYKMHKQMHEKNQRMFNSAIQPNIPHRREEDNDDYFTCKHCFKVFTTKYNLKTHLKTHGINVSPSRSNSKTGKFVKTFWCDICHQACQGYQELQRHKQEHVNENLGDVETIEDDDEIDMKPQLFNCEICSKVFLTQLAFGRHKHRHEQQMKLQKRNNFVYCKYCKVPFMNVEALNYHMAREHNEVRSQKSRFDEKKYMCNICNKSFDTSGALCSHQGWHKRTQSLKTLKSDRPMNQVKQETFSQPSTSYQSPPVHAKSSYHTCRNCGLNFPNDTSLQLHILEVHRNINATLISQRCSICNIDFPSSEAYEKHQLKHKLNPGLFKCKYCPKTFERCESVNMHINQAHPQYNDGNFKCHQCNRHFEKQNALTIHLKVHDRQKLTGAPVKEPKQRTYSCGICFANFDVAKDLRSHIISSHPF